MLHVIREASSIIYIESLAKLLPYLRRKFSLKVTFSSESENYYLTTLTAVHSLNVNLELLWLAKLSPTKVAEWPSTLRVGTASVRSMHLEIVQSQEKLSTILTLICSLSIVELLRMLHDVLLAKDGHPTHLAVVLSYRQTKAGVVEHGAVCTIMKWMVEA